MTWPSDAAWENGLIPRQHRAAEAFGRFCPELIDPKTERLKWDYSHVKALQEDAERQDRRAGQGDRQAVPEAERGPGPAPPRRDRRLGRPGRGAAAAARHRPPARPARQRPQAALPAPEKGKMDRPFERKAKGDAAARRMIDAARAAAGLAADDTPEGRRALCHAVAEHAAAELRAIGEDLAAGLQEKALADATGRAFQAMGRTIRTGALAATLALRGPDGLDEEDRAELTAAVAEQGDTWTGSRRP
jgi:hypothetical protein